MHSTRSLQPHNYINIPVPLRQKGMSDKPAHTLTHTNTHSRLCFSHIRKTLACALPRRQIGVYDKVYEPQLGQ